MSVVDGLLSGSASLVDAVGHPGLAVVMLGESVLPIPSTVVLPLIGTQVASGRLLFWLAALAATAGSVGGAAGLYGVGRSGGRRAALRLPAWAGVTERRLLRAEGWFARWGDAIVLLGRLVPGVRSLVSVPAGTLRMPMARFLALTAVGSLAYNVALIWLGSALVTRWEGLVSASSGPVTWSLAAGGAAAALAVAVRCARLQCGPSRAGQSRRRR